VVSFGWASAITWLCGVHTVANQTLMSTCPIFNKYLNIVNNT
jgi:hypothetical protein